jgi:glycosyltransferase involved in cell wall biosynthesis
MTSLWEGLPLAALEAGASALPVIATPVGAIPALLSNDCGYLASCGGMSETLDSVVDNYQDALEMGLRLRKRVETHFNIDQVAPAHSDLYRSLVLDGTPFVC